MGDSKAMQKKVLATAAILEHNSIYLLITKILYDMSQNSVTKSVPQKVVAQNVAKYVIEKKKVKAPAIAKNISKHLRALEENGIIRRLKAGKENILSLTEVGLEAYELLVKNGLNVEEKIDEYLRGLSAQEEVAT